MPILVFLGAGASKPFGIPTMKEFVDMLNMTKTRKRYEIADDEFALYQRIQGVVRRYFEQKTDFEAIYTVIDCLSRSAPFIDRDSIVQTFYYDTYVRSCFRRISEEPDMLALEHELTSRRHEYADVASRLRMKIERLVVDQCTVKREYTKEIERIYDDFFGCLNRVFGVKDLWIYTTNYDRSVEYYFRDYRGKDIETGFRYNDNLRKSILNPVLFYSKGLKLIKIHGSITFWRNKRLNEIEELKGDPTAQYVPENYEGQTMWFPIEEKKMYTYPYLDMFRALKKDLKSTHKWVIVGHSFNDSIIRQIFVECSKQQNKVLIVLKDKSEAQYVIENNLCDVRGDLIPSENKFGDIELSEEIATNFTKN